ncbi:ABC transporter permease [Cumulibacter manganitolerans]|uniref:ABC transporter permease n=1 Tax=Cumulibacter manganitolerans TaxID=1884992 RepID=UPI0012954B76|nr:ABC transporter permease [Cumulibacter manganitolerans]
MLRRFILRRVLIAIPTLFGLLLVTFVLTSALPGDRAARMLGQRGAADPAIRANFEREWGLDKPPWQQFIIYVGNLFHGNLGRSTMTKRAVATDIIDFLPATIELALVAFLFAGLGGLILGTVAAFFHRRWPDTVVRLFALVASGLPVFWLGLVLLQLLYLQLDIVPGPEGRLSREFIAPPKITGMYTVDALLTGRFATLGNALGHILLPAAVLGLFFLGLLARITRASTLEVLRSPHLVAARSKGLSPWVLLRRHILPNAFVPTLTIMGLAVGGLLAGAVLTETIFSWPGIGRYAVDAAKTLDLQAILGVTLVIGLIYVVTNALVDILYGVLDPRIRIGG